MFLKNGLSVLANEIAGLARFCARFASKFLNNDVGLIMSVIDRRGIARALNAITKDPVNKKLILRAIHKVTGYKIGSETLSIALLKELKKTDYSRSIKQLLRYIKDHPDLTDSQKVDCLMRYRDYYIEFPGCKYKGFDLDGYEYIYTTNPLYLGTEYVYQYTLRNKDIKMSIVKGWIKIDDVFFISSSRLNQGMLTDWITLSIFKHMQSEIEMEDAVHQILFEEYERITKRIKKKYATLEAESPEPSVIPVYEPDALDPTPEDLEETVRETLEGRRTVRRRRDGSERTIREADLRAAREHIERLRAENQRRYQEMTYGTLGRRTTDPSGNQGNVDQVNTGQGIWGEIITTTTNSTTGGTGSF